MKRFLPMFRLSVVLGVLLDWGLYGPAIRMPAQTLAFFGQAPAAEEDLRWVAFASWLAVLVSWFYLPGALAPDRYPFGAWVAVLGRAACAAVLLLLWRGEYAALGWVHLVLFVVQLPLLLLVGSAQLRPDLTASGKELS